MIRNKIFKKWYTISMLSMYAFVVLFASKFHQHNHISLVKSEFNSEKHYVLDLDDDSGNDCIACHFISKIQTFPSLEFDFILISKNEFQNQISELFVFVSNVIFDRYNLRGPPFSI